MAQKKAPKNPNDYPLLGYRVRPEIKANLVSLLEDTLKSLNKARPSHEKPLKKNDIFIEALSNGLKQLNAGIANEREKNK